jgi:hypothetical protein
LETNGLKRPISNSSAFLAVPVVDLIEPDVVTWTRRGRVNDDAKRVAAAVHGHAFTLPTA